MTGHAIVTGSAGGIGAAVCHLLTTQGWRVTGIDIADPPAGAGWTQLTADLADPAEARRAGVRARDEAPVTAIVHCAAVQTLGGAGHVSAADWARTLTVNVVSLDALVGACEDDLRSSGGSVVAVTSVHAFATTASIAAYATSKAALSGWVRAAANDLAPQVRVNAVAPGAVRTPMLESGLARRPGIDMGSALEELAQRAPLRAVAQPADIASVIGTLLDPSVSRFMTGATVVVDGGALVHLSTE